MLSAPPSVFAPTSGPAAAPPRRTAPPAVHVLAVLQYLGGVAAMAVAGLFAYLTVVVVGDPNTPDDFIHPKTLAIAFGVLSAFAAVAGVLGIVLGRMLQTGRPWARVVVLILSGLTIVVVVGSIVVHEAHPTHLMFTLYPALCLALLNTPTVRTWFHGRPLPA